MKKMKLILNYQIMSNIIIFILSNIYNIIKIYNFIKQLYIISYIFKKIML